MEFDLFKLAVVTIALAIIVAFMIIIGVCIEETPPGPATVETVEVVCEHNYVTTSKYNWFLGSYKTFSKCTKCGEEI